MRLGSAAAVRAACLPMMLILFDLSPTFSAQKCAPVLCGMVVVTTSNAPMRILRQRFAEFPFLDFRHGEAIAMSAFGKMLLPRVLMMMLAGQIKAAKPHRP